MCVCVCVVVVVCVCLVIDWLSDHGNQRIVRTRGRRRRRKIRRRRRSKRRRREAKRKKMSVRHGCGEGPHEGVVVCGEFIVACRPDVSRVIQVLGNNHNHNDNHHNDNHHHHHYSTYIRHTPDMLRRWDSTATERSCESDGVGLCKPCTPD